MVLHGGELSLNHDQHETHRSFFSLSLLSGISQLFLTSTGFPFYCMCAKSLIVSNTRWRLSLTSQSSLINSFFVTPSLLDDSTDLVNVFFSFIYVHYDHIWKNGSLFTEDNRLGWFDLVFQCTASVLNSCLSINIYKPDPL